MQTKFETVPGRPVVNDIHSRLNATSVKGVLKPESRAEAQHLIQAAAAEKLSLSVAGGRHAMGGQQFLQNGLLLDTTALNRILAFDAKRGLLTVEAGIFWPELIESIRRLQDGAGPGWSIRQKQTGADRLSVGGALSANIHGRGLRFKPFVEDVVSFELIDANGKIVHCSRTENSELFKLAIGGYGMFGLIYAVTLQLVPRQKLVRRVELLEVVDLMPSFERKIKEGALYGDFQFAIDPRSEDFLNCGILSCYEPVPAGIEIPEGQKSISPAHWEHLLYLAHADKSRGFAEYAAHYKATDGQLYWSDTHQMSYYPDGYHGELDRKLQKRCPGSEMITELYVPRRQLVSFLSEVRIKARRENWNIIYGTIRLIERDDETFLAWAREPWACIVFNLCVEHSSSGIAKAQNEFQALIQAAIEHNGSYYLTYHKWADLKQLLACYPQFSEFLAKKIANDPDEIFTSNWYLHHKRLLG